VPLLHDLGTCDGEQWVIHCLTTLKHKFSHPWNLGRWIDGLGMSRSNHDGTQMGWNPIGWVEYPEAYFLIMIKDVVAADSQR
jgi:hypothetical protein